MQTSPPGTPSINTWAALWDRRAGSCCPGPSMRMWTTRLPLPLPARVRAAAIAAAVLLALVVAYRQLWEDISSPIPYVPWTRAQYGGSWTYGAESVEPWSLLPTQASNPAREQQAKEYLASILSAPGGRHHRRMECPPLNQSRYETLPSMGGSGPDRRFFFALDLRQIVDLLPTLMASLLDVIRFLGPDKCALSIVEGLSTDGTFEVLKALQRELEALGTAYYLQSSSINSYRGDRIGKLAKLRNLALEPILANATGWHPNTTILFINDVAACADDILELLHQKRFQGADMTCAMDYKPLNGRLVFYDVWVARSVDGNSFYEVPGPYDWSHADDMFPHDALSRARFRDRRPFQVFACWNGATAITAAPFLRRQLEFRRAGRGECAAGEPTLLCKDLWHKGYGKILVVPSVSLGYDIDDGAQVKKLKGHTSAWTAIEGSGQHPLKVKWSPHPPEMVRCIPTWRNQYWRPWNQGLGAPPNLHGDGP